MNRILLVVMFLLAAVLPAAAQDSYLDALPGLAGGFGSQAEAVERLGASGDPRALPLLRALSEGQLRKRGTTILLPNGSDAATGQPADATDAETVRINNRVRSALRGALGRLQLVSISPDERFAAA
jgi:urea transport system permease protein